MSVLQHYPPTFPDRVPIVDVDHFRQRVIQDAMNEATAAYWLRRAEQFEWAKSRPGEPLGTDRTEMQRAANDRRLEQVAEMCRAQAAVLTLRVDAA